MTRHIVNYMTIMSQFMETNKINVSSNKTVYGIFISIKYFC